MGQRDALVLSELQAGVLPCDRTVKTWYGSGTWDACDGGSEVVTPPEVKIEADLPSHPRCSTRAAAR